jgi:hypothetical protein
MLDRRYFDVMSTLFQCCFDVIFPVYLATLFRCYSYMISSSGTFHEFSPNQMRFRCCSYQNCSVGTRKLSACLHSVLRSRFASNRLSACMGLAATCCSINYYNVNAVCSCMEEATATLQEHYMCDGEEKAKATPPKQNLSRNKIRSVQIDK